MNINSKKLISLAVVLIMLINIFLPSFSLALEPGKPEFTITSSKTEVKKGETITVTVNVNLNGVTKVGGISPTLLFDSNVLEPQKDTVKRIAPRYSLMYPDDSSVMEMTSIVPYDDKVMMTWTCSKDITYSGDLFSIDFKVKDNATLGATSFQIDNVKDTIHRYPVDEGNPENVEYTVASSKVNVIAPVEGINLDKTTIELWKGESENLNAILTPADTTQTKVTWSSNNNGVATVENGKVTAVAKGNAEITATAENGATAKCTVTVKQPVEGIKLNKTSLELEKNQTDTLVATVLPSDADGDKTVTWDSTNDAVATVENGKVTAIGKGSAEITATVGNYTAKCTVTVGVPLKGISFEGNITEKTLNKGEEFDLVVVYNPVDTDVDKTVTWDSTNDAVATVVDGKVTAVGAGDAKITAKVADKTITCSVRVEIPLNSISIKNATSIKCGQTEKLEVTYNPADATLDKTIKWHSEDENIATVSTDGTVTAKAVGTTKIIAETLSGKTAECEVTVEPVPLEGIEIKEQNITLNKGEEKDLTVLYYPENTTDSKNVKWSVSPEGIVNIENGKVTAIGAGKATITATVGNEQATTEVTVKVPLKEITLNETEVTLNRPETVKLEVTLNPTDATVDGTVEWKSTDEEVATVDENGVVTPHKPGTTYISAKLEDKEATCKVTVKVPLEGISVKETTTILKNQTEELKITLNPVDATYEGKVVYESSDESIATVDENGKITGIKEGTATIKVTAEENGKKFEDTCVVKVEEIKINSIAIDTTDFELGINRTKQLNVIFNPENTTDDKTVVWSSSDETIVKVDKNGKVTALKEGKAEIKATVGEKEAVVTVTSVIIPIESIEIKLPEKVNIGDSFELVVAVNPEDATLKEGMVYTSSNTDIITIDENGRVTALKAGKAIITVETENGIKEQIEVTVEDPNAAVEGEKTESGKIENTSNSPKTSDIAVEMWVALMLVSGLGIATIVIKNRKK